LNGVDRRGQLNRNKMRGRIAEEIAIEDYRECGFTVRRTGIGSDFLAEKCKMSEHVEVKLGGGRLSKRQKKAMSRAKKDGCNYTVYRLSGDFLDYYISKNSESLNEK